MKIQQHEMLGEIQFGKGLYHNQYFEELIKWNKSSKERKLQLNIHLTSINEDLLKENQEYRDRFFEYIDKQYEAMPEELQIDQKPINHLRDVYQVFRTRKTNQVAGNHFISFLNEYVKLFGFEFPIDPELLLKQIHPFYGNLIHLKKFIPFEELTYMIKFLLVATYEKVQGQSLLASKIVATGYYNLFDTNGSGNLVFEDFIELLKVFRLNFNSYEQLENELSLISIEQPALVIPNKIKEIPLGLEIFQEIYLQRNL